MPATIFPAGDEDMVARLRRRVAASGDKPPSSQDHLIPTVDLYGAEPWRIHDVLVAEAAKTGTPFVKGEESIFFTPRQHHLGKRPSRKAGGGHWHSNRMHPVKDSSENVIAIRLLMKYYFSDLDVEVKPGDEDAVREKKRKRKAGTEVEPLHTEHILYEYTLHPSSSDFDEIAICYMKKSPRGGATKADCEAAASKSIKATSRTLADTPSTSRASGTGEMMAAASPSTSTSCSDWQQQSDNASSTTGATMAPDQRDLIQFPHMDEGLLQYLPTYHGLQLPLKCLSDLRDFGWNYAHLATTCSHSGAPAIADHHDLLPFPLMDEHLLQSLPIYDDPPQ